MGGNRFRPKIEALTSKKAAPLRVGKLQTNQEGL